MANIIFQLWAFMLMLITNIIFYIYIILKLSINYYLNPIVQNVFYCRRTHCNIESHNRVASQFTLFDLYFDTPQNLNCIRCTCHTSLAHTPISAPAPLPSNHQSWSLGSTLHCPASVRSDPGSPMSSPGVDRPQLEHYNTPERVPPARPNFAHFGGTSFWVDDLDRLSRRHLRSNAGRELTAIDSPQPARRTRGVRETSGEQKKNARI